MLRISKCVLSVSVFVLLLLPILVAYAQVYEISGSPFSVEGAPLPNYIPHNIEKVIVVYPHKHVWGAYKANGRLVRWGIATAGADQCLDSSASCRTKTGDFRVYSLGSVDCVSKKYNDAPMPYCMYFNGGQALHGSGDIQFDNVSHGCVRLHVDDAKWLRFHFVEGPSSTNHYHGTRVVIKSYIP